jgi:uncharacterized tellurite resistance protein B-like protein|tara:strand:+ start:121 stop:579 length:459 start_codon:yes stop_codon:yes gene_type:complete
MISSIRNFFESKIIPEKEEQGSGVNSLDLACAALLIEVIKSDHELDQRETNEFLAVLRTTFEIDNDDLNELAELAEKEAHDATSLYEFTRLINDGYDYPKKMLLIENMWRIAFSDDELDKYEEHLIRRVSELIYISHSDFIRTKLNVRNPEK